VTDKTETKVKSEIKKWSQYSFCPPLFVMASVIQSDFKILKFHVMIRKRQQTSEGTVKRHVKHYTVAVTNKFAKMYTVVSVIVMWFIDFTRCCGIADACKLKTLD